MRAVFLDDALREDRLRMGMIDIVERVGVRLLLVG